MNPSQNNHSNPIDITTVESPNSTNQHHQRKRPRIDGKKSPEILSWTATRPTFPNNPELRKVQNEEQCNENDIDESDGEVVIQSSSVTNPNIDFSHLRSQCGLHPYDKEPNLFCSKCFCSVCDLPVQNCASWTQHSLIQTNSVARNNTKKKTKNTSRGEIQSEAITITEVNNLIDPSVQRHYNEMFRDLYNESMNGTTDNANRDLWRDRKSQKQMKITEILAKKLSLTVLASESNPQDVLNMEGDIPKMSLHDLFYVEGVKIGWPFPRILPPQRMMAMHLIRGLKRSNHVVMESPTGTGKSAAILCSVLAWQRYHAKKHIYSSTSTNSEIVNVSSNFDNGEVEVTGSKPKMPKIIYCSRTHSQVAQMVASLKKTPYRPRMTVLGSRERLCIHREMTTIGRQDGEVRASSRVNINQECQYRVSNTEKMRKSLWHSINYPYDDDDPPVRSPGDGSGENNFNSVDLTEQTETSTDVEIEENSPTQGTQKLTCPHYRQLSSARTSVMLRSRFILNKSVISCCKVGGEKTSLGVHDIEDLVSFGINPYIHRGVAVYRNGGAGKFGMGIDQPKGAAPLVATIAKDGAAASTGAINENDSFLKINGKKSVDWNLQDVVSEIRETKNDPLEMDIIRSGVPYDDESDVSYHDHSACPYYLSRAVLKHAELIIAPYNYVLDPMIRTALDIELEGNVVILDEAHNVEDTLRDSGSGKYGEIELCELICMLSDYATRQKTRTAANQSSDEAEIDISVLAHEILLMLEKVVEFLISSRKRFENGVGMNSANGAIDEYQQYNSPDDKLFEVTFDGPTGYGIGGKAVGCKPFFDKMGFTQAQFSKLSEYAKELESRLGGNVESDNNDSFNAMRRNNTLLSLLNAFVTKFLMAILKPEHYFVQSSVHPNGSFAFASGQDDGSNRSRFRKKPKSFPFIRPRTLHNPNAVLFACPHKCCQSNQNLGTPVSHGNFCDGTTPRWESVLILELLTPGILMEDISSQCRTIVLASGSLAPISSLCAELNLYPSTPNVTQHDLKSGSPITPKMLNKPGRLQVVPKPLEANHVINHDKQLRTVSIGSFPDGSALTVSYSHYKNLNFFPKLGNAIATIVEAIPRGGVLIFVPSYSFLRKCVRSWDPSSNNNRWSYTQSNDEEDSSIWERFISSKGQVIVEPTGNQEKFELAKKEYNDAILNEGKCILLAVFRGKMSEGISFNDDFARAVICVGIPFPNIRDKAISAKRNYNDEQRKLCNRIDLLPGQDWYLQQAYRAIAQALGRCIRHDADYGVIILMDSRHCEGEGPVDRLSHKHRNLPKWMREHVYDLSLSNHYRIESNKKIIWGGYSGLARELKDFFIEAPKYTKTIIENRKKTNAKMQKREFDSNTGKWELKTDTKRQISLSPMTEKNTKS